MTSLDRYDYALALLSGLIAVAILVLYGAVWAVALAYVIGWTAILIRHIDEFRVK
jgi:hypothetical protein